MKYGENGKLSALEHGGASGGMAGRGGVAESLGRKDPTMAANVRADGTEGTATRGQKKQQQGGGGACARGCRRPAESGLRPCQGTGSSPW